MIESDAKTVIASALRSANIVGWADSEQERAFLSGGKDIRIDELHMDSLAAMEFCVFLEVETGLSLNSDELRLVGTLEKLSLLIS